MKLKNKISGEIKEFALFDGNELQGGVTLEILTKEWEDYEEPKDWWYIDIHGPHKVTNNDEYYQQVKVASKEIGNYFESKEEAEKAVEKLKAWKRLKDKGFKFSEWEEGTKNYKVIITGILPKGLLDDEQDNDDLGLLFSQEDD